MYQVPSMEQFQSVQQQLAQALQRLSRLEAAQPEWLREEEAQQLTGLSQATLARERKKPDTLLVFKTVGGLRYLRSSVEAYNEARTIKRSRYPRAAA
jgi:hypothetical protein